MINNPLLVLMHLFTGLRVRPGNRRAGVQSGAGKHEGHVAELCKI